MTLRWTQEQLDLYTRGRSATGRETKRRLRRTRTGENETALVKAILELLRLRGIFAWRQNSGGMAAEYNGKKRFVRFTVAGCSDVLGVLPGGRLLAIEAKIGRNTVTKDQLAFLLTVNRAGGLAFVAYSLDHVIQALAGTELLTNRIIDSVAPPEAT